MPNVRPLPPKLAEEAKKELQEDPDRLEKDLNHLKEWLAKQPHLKARQDDQFLVAFLRGCKFSLERAKEKLDAYYTLRTALPEFFKCRDPTAPEIKHLMKNGLFLPLGVDSEGRRVILFRAGKYNTSKARPNDIFKASMMVLDVLLLEDDDFVVNGLVGVLDQSGMTMAHATHVSPALAKKAMVIYQDGYPIRPKAFHYLHITAFFETLFNLLKSLMKEKLQKRIWTHVDVASLHHIVPKEILPEEYGGSAGPVQALADKWAQKLLEWREYFLEDEKFCVDESKRPGKPKTHQDLFGLEGTFRQLAVD